MVGVLTSLLVGFLYALLLLFERQQYPALFSSSAEVKLLVEELTPLLALSFVLFCVQNTVCGNILLQPEASHLSKQSTYTRVLASLIYDI